MKYDTREVGGKWILVIHAEEPIADKAQANELVSLSMENGTPLVLFEEGALSPEFTDLRTGVAGEVMQKLVNYHMTAAAVLSTQISQSGRFGELMLEMNRGSTFRSFSLYDEALGWLAQQG
jgi:hypothetical protein